MRSMLGRTVAASGVGIALLVSVVVGVADADTEPVATCDTSTTTTTTSTTTDPSSTTTVDPCTTTTTTTTTPTTTSTSATTTASTSTTTTTTTSTTTTTTTTLPPLLVVEIPDPITAQPTRGTAVQVAETLPPPTTTTTTVPPEWNLPANSGEGRRIVYRKTYPMRVWTVEASGSVSKTHLVSGRADWNQPTPGTYSVFSRSGYTCNINNPHICWRYMVRFTKGPGGDNIGFHEIPTNTESGGKLQSESQLGLALSGGCVRQATPDAQWIWDWAPIGTKVVVLP